jgi:ribosomal protein L13E
MNVVPADTPVTMPESDPAAAIEASAEDHVPPPKALLSVVVDATQISKVPVMFAGSGFTVKFTDRLHPVGIV